ncbi:hypothetical protein DL96DRAFT_16736 [Flagelloscypha sp. PMI_526]|nr:hypothetical protein DL96DRAFT_16736 [Flagelloscypha sp. PMI_526]
MVRQKLNGPLGPSRLKQTLEKLVSAPNLRMAEITTLKFRLAMRHNTGARHFANETLPRIQWFNPRLDIEFSKAIDPTTKKPIENATSTMELAWKNGKVVTLDLHNKSHRGIIEELMDLTGSNEWRVFKETGKDPVLGRLSVPREQAQARLEEERKKKNPTEVNLEVNDAAEPVTSPNAAKSSGLFTKTESTRESKTPILPASHAAPAEPVKEAF